MFLFEVFNLTEKIYRKREVVHYATSDRWKFFATSWLISHEAEGQVKNKSRVVKAFSRSWVCICAFCKFLPILSGKEKEYNSIATKNRIHFVTTSEIFTHAKFKSIKLNVIWISKRRLIMIHLISVQIKLQLTSMFGGPDEKLYEPPQSQNWKIF